MCLPLLDSSALLSKVFGELSLPNRARLLLLFLVPLARSSKFDGRVLFLGDFVAHRSSGEEDARGPRHVLGGLRGRLVGLHHLHVVVRGCGLLLGVGRIGKRRSDLSETKRIGLVGARWPRTRQSDLQLEHGVDFSAGLVFRDLIPVGDRCIA